MSIHVPGTVPELEASRPIAKSVLRSRPAIRAISLDFGSKMSDLTREIILSDSITSLLKSSKILSTYLESRRTDLELINKNIANKELHIKELEKLVAENSISINHLNEVTVSIKTEIEKLEEEINKQINK